MKVIFTTSTSPQHQTSLFVFTLITFKTHIQTPRTSARWFRPYKGDDAHKKRNDEAIKWTSYSPPAMARKTTSSSRSGGGLPSIIIRASESAPSPKGVHRDEEATSSTPAVLLPSTSRPKPPFTLYLAWWRQVSLPSTILARLEQNINISAEPGERCAGSCGAGCPCRTALGDATRRRRGAGRGGARKSRVGRREGRMWHTSEIPHRAPYNIQYT